MRDQPIPISNRLSDVIESLSIPLAIGILLSLGCLLLFGAIADEVIEQDELVAIDLALANELHSQATNTSTSIYRIVSFIGSPGLFIVGVILAVVFALKRQWARLLVGTIAMLGGALLNTVLKLVFARPRPIFVDPILQLQDHSFPSGHAMISLIGFGILTYLVWNRLRNPYLKIIIVFGATLLVILIGISRMALGVHYLSDVVAGYAVGGVWLGSCIIAYERLSPRFTAHESSEV